MRTRAPKPQTRFVLSHALERGLRIVVVVNKIDRPNADPEGAVDKVFDLMVELGASDEQLDFPVVYASAVNGYARLDPNDGNMDMVPLLDTILSEIPPPTWTPRARLRCRFARSTTAATRVASASAACTADPCTRRSRSSW